MNEAEWRACAEPQRMLEFLRGRASERKLRLFACACVRRVWHLLPDARSRRAVEVAERFADGEADAEMLRLAAIGAASVAEAGVNAAATPAEQAAASAAFAALNATGDAARAADYCGANAASAAYHAATAADVPSAAAARAAERAAQARLLREVFGNPVRPARVHEGWLAWGGGTVPRLGAAVYEERAFERLPILADALEDAGCSDAELLAHCRSGSGHVPGCWAVDLLTDNE
jgi:hypothetical protein